MVGLAALDLVLRQLGARAMRVALVIEVVGMNPDDRAADVTGFRVPADPIADLESLRSSALLLTAFARPFSSETVRTHLSTRGRRSILLLEEVRACRACADVLPLARGPSSRYRRRRAS